MFFTNEKYQYGYTYEIIQFLLMYKKIYLTEIVDSTNKVYLVT